MRPIADLQREAALAREELEAFRRNLAARPPENAVQRRLATARGVDLCAAVDAAVDALEAAQAGRGARLMSPEEWQLERRREPPCGCSARLGPCEQHLQAAGTWSPRGYARVHR